VPLAAAWNAYESIASAMDVDAAAAEFVLNVDVEGSSIKLPAFVVSAELRRQRGSGG
jgi:hypothetical protein